MWAFIFVNNPTFLKFIVLVFWCHEKLLDGVGSLEMNLYALFIASPLELLSQPMHVGYHNGDDFMFVMVDGNTGVVVVGMLLFC